MFTTGRENKIRQYLISKFGENGAITILGPGFQNLINRMNETDTWTKSKEHVYRDLQYFYGKLRLLKKSQEKSHERNPTEAPFWVFLDIKNLVKNWETCEELQTMLSSMDYVDTKADYISLLSKLVMVYLWIIIYYSLL